MAENDIYNNQKRYENFISNIDKLTNKPTNRKQKYYCKNPINIQYFRILITHTEVKDLSYIRRLRVMQILKLITFITKKDLQECEREDINEIISFTHTTHKTVASKRDVIKDLKCIWKVLFPEKDQKGRIDESITPYVVRHLSRSVDKSKEKIRNDRLTYEEFQKIVHFFAHDKRIQAYLMLAFESLGRPQEILYTKIKDYEFHENFAKVWVCEHSKEGVGILQCIDSLPYVLDWYNNHPQRDNPDSYFFINIKPRTNNIEQLRNDNINKLLKKACRKLGITKNITCYSLKRNGVTFRRQRGDSDVQIQHAARWSSTKQLQVYDMTTQQDAFTLELEKRGFDNTHKSQDINTKNCMFCSHSNGFTSNICVNCKRPLDRKKIEEMTQIQERVNNNDMLQRFDKIEKMFEMMMGKS